MKWIEVPEFGITTFKTIKDINSMNFRPSVTSLNISDSILGMEKEKKEQEDMLKSYQLVKNKNDKNHLYKVIPAEKMHDTNWYYGSQIPGVEFYKVRNYKGDLNKKDSIILPKDIVLFKDQFNLENKSELHWATSGGFATDYSVDVAVSKGLSELVENHFKMFWWFNESPIYKLETKNKALNILKNQNIVKSVNVYLLGLPEKIGSFVLMSILETKQYPFVSVGFAAHKVLKSAITHSLYEAVHYYRGVNWYKMMGDNEDYIKKNNEILTLIKKTMSDVFLESNISKKLCSSLITKNYQFFSKILSFGSKMVTVKTFSPDLQPLVNSEYVPFFFSELVNKKNVKKRLHYKGVPFI